MSTSSSSPRLAFGRRRDARDAVEYIGRCGKINRASVARSTKRVRRHVDECRAAVTTHPRGKSRRRRRPRGLRGKIRRAMGGGYRRVTTRRSPVQHRHARARARAGHRIDDCDCLETSRDRRRGIGGLSSYCTEIYAVYYPNGGLSNVRIFAPCAKTHAWRVFPVASSPRPGARGARVGCGCGITVGGSWKRVFEYGVYRRSVLCTRSISRWKRRARARGRRASVVGGASTTTTKGESRGGASRGGARARVRARASDARGEGRDACGVDGDGDGDGDARAVIRDVAGAV